MITASAHPIKANGSSLARSTRVKQIKPPSLGAAIAKTAFGAMYLVIAITESHRGASYVAISLILGVALIAWGVLAFRKGKRAWEEHQRTLREQEASRVRTCPHCGAHTAGSVCEYCGSPLD